MNFQKKIPHMNSHIRAARRTTEQIESIMPEITKCMFDEPDS